jgi:histidinol-phosphate aminotransferase
MNKFQKYALPGVQQLTPYLPGKPVEELERELGIRDSIKLASNENPLGPSAKAVAAARSVLQRVHFYPDGGGHDLRQALARKHGVDADRITLGNGSNDVLELVARAFLAPCYGAVFSEYAFAVYPILTQATGAEQRLAPALPADHPSMPYGHDLQALLDRIDNSTRVVFIANPNNPTGTWLDPAELENFIRAVPDDVILVLDEAYYEYMPAALQPASELWLHKYDNLVVTRTFSKIYGLAGLRIGYAISHADVADLLNRVRQPFNCNMPAQAAALAALDDQPHLDRSVQLNRSGLQQLAAGFDRLGLGYIPSIGNFISLDVGRDAGEVYQALLRKGVIVRPLAAYKMPRHLRITVGTGEQNHRVLDALGEVLK